MNQTNEKELVHLLNLSSVPAFDELFHRYNKSIYHFCKKVLFSREEAEEVVISVFLSLWENRNKIDPEQAFGAYIFSIARYQTIDCLKKIIHQQRYIEHITKQKPSFNFQTEDQINFNETQQLIDSLINRLPQRRREIFQLSRHNNLSYKEIALQLNISENTIDTQIRRALDYLRYEINRHSEYKIK